MKKRHKNILLLLLLFLCIAPFQHTLAQSNATVLVNRGFSETAGKVAGDFKKNRDIPTMIGKALGVLLYTVAVIFFILMVYAGILWMTARGKEDQAKKAQSTIIAASVGLIIVLSSYSLTSFLFASLESEKEGDKGCCVFVNHQRQMSVYGDKKHIPNVEACQENFTLLNEVMPTYADFRYFTNFAGECNNNNPEIVSKMSALTDLFVPELCPNAQVLPSTKENAEEQNACIGARTGDSCALPTSGGTGTCGLKEGICLCNTPQE